MKGLTILRTAAKNVSKRVYVIGHKNPDTDSVVSAAAAEMLQLLSWSKP